MMSINEARLIKHIKKGCTYRRLAEIYYTKENELHGMQWSGQDLCREACDVLGINWRNPPKGNKEFDEENQSRLSKGLPEADFFYWFD